MIKIISLSFLATLLIISCISSCDNSNRASSNQRSKNEVLVLGTIHSGHLKDSIYNTAYLEKLIIDIDPDFILAEIPPHLMQDAVDLSLIHI